MNLYQRQCHPGPRLPRGSFCFSHRTSYRCSSSKFARKISCLPYQAMGIMLFPAGIFIFNGSSMRGRSLSPGLSSCSQPPVPLVWTVLSRFPCRVGKNTCLKTVSSFPRSRMAVRPSKSLSKSVHGPSSANRLSDDQWYFPIFVERICKVFARELPAY